MPKPCIPVFLPPINGQAIHQMSDDEFFLWHADHVLFLLQRNGPAKNKRMDYEKYNSLIFGVDGDEAADEAAAEVRVAYGMANRPNYNTPVTFYSELYKTVKPRREALNKKENFARAVAAAAAAPAPAPAPAPAAAAPVPEPEVLPAYLPPASPPAAAAAVAPASPPPAAAVPRVPLTPVPPPPPQQQQRQPVQPAQSTVATRLAIEATRFAIERAERAEENEGQLRREVAGHITVITQLEGDLRNFQDDMRNQQAVFTAERQSDAQRIAEMEDKLEAQATDLRRLQIELAHLKGSVTVFVRIRPEGPQDEGGNRDEVQVNSNQIKLPQPVSAYGQSHTSAKPSGTLRSVNGTQHLQSPGQENHRATGTQHLQRPAGQSGANAPPKIFIESPRTSGTGAIPKTPSNRHSSVSFYTPHRQSLPQNGQNSTIKLRVPGKRTPRTPHLQSPGATASRTPSPRQTTARFDKVFGTDTSQDQVFAEFQPFVSYVVAGYKVCFFAYGQTGSGKTYSMDGGAAGSQSEGLVGRSMKEMFSQCQFLQQKGWSHTLVFSCIEIYNEVVSSLLPYDTVEVGSFEEFQQLYSEAKRARTVKKTGQNSASSRSHMVCKIGVNGVKGDLLETNGMFYLVDLAGSEPYESSKEPKETTSINTSISSLGRVLKQLSDGAPPTFDSKLTEYLKDVLQQGRAKVVMLANISPFYSAQTKATLTYASTAKGICLGTAQQSARF